MSETLDHIRYRLSMDALAGFLNGPRAFSSQAGKTTGTAVSRHPPGGMPRFEQVTDLLAALIAITGDSARRAFRPGSVPGHGRLPGSGPLDDPGW
jgi:hypothetical protein